MNTTDKLTESVICAANETKHPDVALRAKFCVLDYLGVTYAGAQMSCEKMSRYIALAENGSVCPIGFEKALPKYEAAFVNGFSSHVAELDDGSRFAALHPGGPVLSALFAVADSLITGNDFLRGVCAGYEASIRIGKAMQPSHKKRGYHSTGTCGTIGAAAAVSIALRAQKTQLKGAISAAAASAAGLLEMQEDASEMKPYNSARAAMDGLAAACAARAQFVPPCDAVGGKRGLFAVMSDEAQLLTDDGAQINNIYVKPYAACRHCHSPIEAALRLGKKVDAEAVEAIDVRTYSLAVRGHDHNTVEGSSSAKMSIPYCVAVAFLRGSAGIDDFGADDKAVLELTSKVRVTEDAELTALCPQKRAAVVTVTTKDGTQYCERVDYPRGEPENPISKAEIEEKFMSLAMYGGKSESEAKAIIAAVDNMDKDIEGLLKII